MTVNEQVRAYVILIERGRMTLEEVPEELREQVESQMIPEIEVVEE